MLDLELCLLCLTIPHYSSLCLTMPHYASLCLTMPHYRLRLFELLDERSGSGSRLGVVSPLDDDDGGGGGGGGASAAEAAPLRAEADAARTLLHSAATPLELSLCTLDEARPALHPLTALASPLPPLYISPRLTTAPCSPCLPLTPPLTSRCWMRRCC